MKEVVDGVDKRDHSVRCSKKDSTLYFIKKSDFVNSVFNKRMKEDVT